MMNSNNNTTPYRLLFLLGFVLVTLPAVAAQQTAEEIDTQATRVDSADPETEGSAAAAPAPTRAPQTRGEIERALDLARREYEDLKTRIGDAEPTEKQAANLAGVLTIIGTLEERLENVQEATKQEAEEEGDSFKGRWTRVRSALQDATRYDLKDGMFRFSLGIRLQLDATFGAEDTDLEALVGGIPSSFQFRRSRVFARGRLFRTLDFMFEYDFGADQGFKDAYLDGAKFTKYFNWRIGHFKEPFSLARQMSAYNLAFIEWALPVPTFTPGRGVGLMLRHSEINDRLFWAVSATTASKLTDDNRSDANISITGRLTALPLMRDKGRRLIHLGISASQRDPSDSTGQYSTRPEARFAPFFADTGQFSAETGTLGALEFATVQGPLWLQAEYFRTRSSSTGEEFEFVGGYAEVGWFLTGEHRFYVTDEAAFGRLTPTRLFRGGNPFRKGSEGGALEFVGRFSTTDLNDGTVQGGELRNFSVGLNWYLSQVNRVSLNYVHSYLLDVGRANIVLLRFQYSP